MNATPTTKKAQLEEIVRCGKNPVHFINGYCKIQHPKRGMVPFKTYPFQDDCIRQFTTNRFNIIVKSRQLGISTISAAYVAWFALFRRDKNILVIATKLPIAVNFIKKVKLILANLPQWLRITTWQETAQEIKFENGSHVHAIPTSPSAGRSEALSLLVIDEAAHIRDFEEIWTSIYPTLNLGGDAIILSTPNGASGQYYKIFKDAQARLNEFNPILLPWNVHPEHDDAWFAKESRQFSRRQINQEFLCQFVGSGDTVLAQDELDWLSQSSIAPMRKEGPNNSIWTWHDPIPGHRYVIPADVSRGDSGDYSTFHVIDVDDKNIAVEFMGYMPPDRFGDLMATCGKRYNNALLVPENNTFGFTTCMRLKALEYKQLYHQGMTSDNYSSYAPSPKEVPGFSTQRGSRDQILAKMEELLRNRMVQPYSSRLAAEFQTFIYNGNRPQAMKDEHDDLILSFAIGCWILDRLFNFKGSNNSKTPLFNGGLMKFTTSFDTVPGAGHDVKPIIRPTLVVTSGDSKQRLREQRRVFEDFKWVVS
jgi:hypothetical protein